MFRDYVRVYVVWLYIIAFMCDFENVSTPHCNWTNDSEQGASWKHHSEETLLEGTGPDFDHTYGIDGTGNTAHSS